MQDRATGDTVKIARPGPAHSVAHADVDGIRHKGEFVSFRSHGHIENLASDVPFSTHEPGVRTDRRCGSLQSLDFPVLRQHSLYHRP